MTHLGKRLLGLLTVVYFGSACASAQPRFRDAPPVWRVDDDQSIAATAVSLYEKLATVDNVDLFVGPDWSSHGFPVSQIFEKYKIPSVMSNVATRGAPAASLLRTSVVLI